MPSISASRIPPTRALPAIAGTPEKKIFTHVKMFYIRPIRVIYLPMVSLFTRTNIV